ncbi:mannitol operon transcriptional antiterminator [Propionispira arboris]|uniref:Mannitol operon transcriptional antiterminator n=1 Tax=Propionispira arboris TaxID=84035 RepID=A0A1H7AXF2_9FIRM|nr:PRD domain-containing protein [Propionispira arboris]SEJ69596.1 mannitol operon transcriptional antiterminator [Propionispira arboris]
MKISSRAKAILAKVCQETSYITIAAIAKELDVSAKTIVRELPEVETVLKRYGLELDKKTGAGIGVHGNMTACTQVLQLLDESRDEHTYSPLERQTVIISKLLQNQAPVKLFEFASILKVTEGTISNDLDKLEPWFIEHALVLVRKPGLGVYVEGEENDIRKAIVHYIYENIKEDQLLDLVHDNLVENPAVKTASLKETQNYLLDLVDVNVIHKLEKAVRDVETQMKYQLSDNAFVGLIVHLALAVQRLRKSEKIEINKDFLNELQEKKEFSVARKISEKIADLFAIAVPDTEIGYITMHLLGARNRYSSHGASMNVVDNFHLVKLAKSMMRIAQQETGKALLQNEKLLVGLVNHLGPSISRLKMKMDIRNPLLEDMQKHYPELLEISRKCVKDLEHELDLVLPESELAYIAMHLGAAIEDSDQLSKIEHRILIACPTGMGTSRMLASRIQKEYANLKVVDVISALHVNNLYINQVQAEFVVSTVPIPNCMLPVVVVNSLLNEVDKEKINKQIVVLGETILKQAAKMPAPYDFKTHLMQLNEYSRAIVDLLDSFFFAEDKEASTIMELCENIGKLVDRDAAKQKDIMAALLNREEYGGTVIRGNKMILLHCRSAAISHLTFGIIHLNQYEVQTEFETKIEQIKTAIVMLAPQNAHKYSLETIGYISTILLERWGLIELLHEGDQKLIYLELVKIFKEFYQKKYKILLEG